MTDEDREVVLEALDRYGGSPLSICFVAVCEATARVALAADFSVLKVGEEPWFDLATWYPPRGNRGKKLRWAVNHARAAGVEAEEYSPHRGRDRRVEGEVLEVLSRWRTALGRPEPESFLRAAPLEVAELKRIFLARRGGRVEAVLSCARLPAVNGWYLEDLIRVPEAVNGATELPLPGDCTLRGTVRAERVAATLHRLPARAAATGSRACGHPLPIRLAQPRDRGERQRGVSSPAEA